MHHLNVPSEVALPKKLPQALVTLVRLFFFVHSSCVDIQRALLTELLQAFVALVQVFIIVVLFLVTPK